VRLARFIVTANTTLGVHRVVNTGFQTALARFGNVIDAIHGASFTKLE
jgi:hypothetical protein